MQRGSVLVLTLLIISIEAGPYVNSTYTRLAFNKVGKAGGSTLTSILGHLARNNGLTIVRPKRFNPSADELATALKVLRSGHVYSNHAGHLRMNVSNLAWINIVREPIDREQSLYYYFIDPLARKAHKANASLVARQRDTRCGCAGLEFDQCVRLRHTRGCVLGCTSGQMRAFCEPKSACSFAEAMVMLEDYVFVGLMEEYGQQSTSSRCSFRNSFRESARYKTWGSIGPSVACLPTLSHTRQDWGQYQGLRARFSLTRLRAHRRQSSIPSRNGASGSLRRMSLGKVWLKLHQTL